MAEALNGLVRVKLLTQVTVPGGIGMPGDVVDVSVVDARSLAHYRQAIILEEA